MSLEAFHNYPDNLTILAEGQSILFLYFQLWGAYRSFAEFRDYKSYVECMVQFHDVLVLYKGDCRQGKVYYEKSEVLVE